MNIFVVNGYVRQNKGDAALLSVICHEMERVFSGANIVISNQENPAQFPFFESWENKGSFMQYVFDDSITSIRRLCRLLICFILPIFISYNHENLITRVLPKSVARLVGIYRNSDLIVSMGGGYLNGEPTLLGTIGVYVMLLPLILSKKLGLCYVLAPQSVGPFGTRVQRFLINRYLNRADLILIREAISENLLINLGIKNNLIRSVDSGFLFTSSIKIDLRKQLNVPAASTLIGVTARQWLNDESQNNYEQVLADTIEHILEYNNTYVVILPQVTNTPGKDDDRITGAKIFDRVQPNKKLMVLNEDYDAYQIKSMYSQLSFLIGTRFHSVIFALSSYVPCIGIEYEHKTSGIMKDLELENWSISINELDINELIELVDSLLLSAEDYKNHLKSVLPDYIVKARLASDLIFKAWKSQIS